MFSHLQINDPRERWLVGLADAALAAGTLPMRLLPRPIRDPGRILLLRLERIGDLLMTLAAIAETRLRAPNATIDLVVGSWNEPIARMIPGIDRIETLDVPWLAREGAGLASHELTGRALAWRARKYDLALNFEGDIRSNLLLWLSGARRRVGFDMAGGGPLLTDRARFDPQLHTAINVLRLVSRAFGGPARSKAIQSIEELDCPRLTIPDEAQRRVAALLANQPHTRMIGVHAGGGREIKQWPAERFAEAATRIARLHEATIVLTGSEAERAVVASVRGAIPHDVRVIDLAGKSDLAALAALLERCEVLVTADTGPMHLAAAVGTPVVAVFGLSEPARYGPVTRRRAIVRVNLPCSPCNRVRLPPARCRGHVPDCLTGVTVDQVCQATESLLSEVKGLGVGLAK